jgi:uncharacterized membrane protein YedE/YeeE
MNNPAGNPTLMRHAPLQRTAAALFSGALFAVGLVLGGMTQPSKVIGFLDIFGAWDPSLLFVMAGAVSTYALLFRLSLRRPMPLFAESFQVPSRKDIDLPLLAGALLFGVGWGLSGYCPGPALCALATGRAEAFLFVGSMLLGMVVTKLFVAWRAQREDSHDG